MLKQFFFVFVFFLSLSSSLFAQTIEETNQGTFTFLVPDISIDSGGIKTLLSTSSGSSLIRTWYDYNGQRTMVLLESGALYAWYFGQNETVDNVQDLMTLNIYSDGRLPEMFVNGEPFYNAYWNGAPSGSFGGEIVFGDGTIDGTGTFSRTVFTQQQIMEQYQTYKRYGNFGNTIIDKFFNQVFSLMRGN